MKIETEVIKKYNKSAIIRCMQNMRTATKKDIAIKTGLSVTTVATILNDFVKSKIVVKAKRADSTGGRRPELYMLNKNLCIILNIQIENDKFSIQLINIIGEIVFNKTVKYLDDSQTTLEIIDEIRPLLSKYSIRIVGIGVPGIVKDKGYLVNCQLENIGQKIEEEFQVDVHLVNDLNAIAYGYSIEHVRQGNDGPTDNIMYIHINESCSGAGIVMNGNIVIGSSHFAGEVGCLRLRNGKTFDELISESTNEQFYEILIDLIIACNCIINPELIILGGNHRHIKQVSGDKINELILQQSYTDVWPEIQIENKYEKYYKQGLLHIIMNLYLERIYA